MKLSSACLEGLANPFHKNGCIEGDINKEKALLDTLASNFC